ncbi:hypothetical protein SO802_019915 [Lithocarpus litseifolius]|uniref:Uncharacterized protein n=1 Tax=Lithocarpus litseifolius TaxID=425828 RepID=A0AAW2CS09_9ROSI
MPNRWKASKMELVDISSEVMADNTHPLTTIPMGSLRGEPVLRINKMLVEVEKSLSLGIDATKGFSSLTLCVITGSDDFTREHAVGCNTNVMGYHFPEGTQEHEELVWLAKSFKLEMTEYSQQIYSPGGYAYPSGDDDDDGKGDGGGDLKVTPSYLLRKRRFW